jgi:hypothetical protein
MVAGDIWIFADLCRVVEVGAVELVAEEGRLVVVHELECWFGVATAVGEGGEGGYNAEEHVMDAHVSGWEGAESSVRGLTTRLEVDDGVADGVEV